jgi:hypothetical protein
LGGMKQIYAWYWNWYKADVYHNTFWQLRHKLSYFLEMLEVSKNAFLKEQIFVKEN